MLASTNAIDGSSVWTSIKGPINEYMQQIREIRLHKIYMDTLKPRVASLEKAMKDVLAELEGHAVTCWECEARIPALFDIVNPEKKEFNLGDLHSTLRPLLQDYLRKRDDIARQELSSAIRRFHDLDKSVDPFALAVGSLFRCNSCAYVFSPQETIHHICREYSYPRKKPGWMSRDYFDAICRCTPRWTVQLTRLIWTVDDFTNSRSLGKASLAIKACGFDVKTATAKDLDEDKNLRLICLNHKSDGDIPIMTWRTAVRYFTLHHRMCHRSIFNINGSFVIVQAFHARPCCHSPKYERATEKQVLAAQECETQIKEDSKNDRGYCDFSCAHCSNPTPGSKRDVIRHIGAV